MTRAISLITNSIPSDDINRLITSGAEERLNIHMVHLGRREEKYIERKDKKLSLRDRSGIVNVSSR